VKIPFLFIKKIAKKVSFFKFTLFNCIRFPCNCKETWYNLPFSFLPFQPLLTSFFQFPTTNFKQPFPVPRLSFWAEPKNDILLSFWAEPKNDILLSFWAEPKNDKILNYHLRSPETSSVQILEIGHSEWREKFHSIKLARKFRNIPILHCPLVISDSDLSIFSFGNR